ncbi:MAG: hypothetical protein JW951_04965 [Lentisphaerae bacterium]|nr:hypothetical protein [Lentisphaerota bacterium]
MIVFEHAVPAALIWTAAAVAAAGCAWTFRRYMPRRRGAWGIALARILFLALLAWCLFLPGRKTVLTRMLQPHFVVILDTSESMLLTPPGADSPARWETARAALALPWAEPMEAACTVDLYTLDADVSRTLPRDAAAGLEPAGTATRLRAGLRTIGTRYAGLNVAGALLLSDGLDTREAFDDWAAEERPFPIHTVRLEPEAVWEAEPELRVDTVDTPRRVTAGWQSELKAVVSGQGTGGRAVTVRLRRDGERLAETPVTLPAAGGSREVVFELNHPEVGVFTYRVSVPALPGEAHTNDNAYAVTVQVVTERNRLLYVEGPPRWESKYLTRALRANRQMTPLIFLRGPGGKFMTFGERGSMTADMLDAQLAYFKIVVLGDLDAGALGDARARNLVRFVETGGSLILLGGPDAWGPDGFAATPLQALLPVRPAGAPAVGGEFPVHLTDSGRAHPAFAGDAALWQDTPPVLSVFPDAAVKAGTRVLVTAETPDGAQPIIVTERYGQGRVAAVLTDSLWRWQLGTAPGPERPYQRFWDQLIAWMIPEEQEREGPRLDLVADREQVFLGEPVLLSARARDGGPALSAVACEMTRPDGRTAPYTMEAREIGTASGDAFAGYELAFSAEQPGLYTARAAATAAGGRIESDPVSFFVKPFTPETVPRPANETVLRAIAENSGGGYYETLEALNDALASLDTAGVEEQAAEYHTLWQHGLTIGALMALLIAGWALRKGMNLP